jgi:hypothetical protein
LRRCATWPHDFTFANEPTFPRDVEATTTSFPTFEELDAIAEQFGMNNRWLQIEFGYLEEDELAYEQPPVVDAGPVEQVS